MKSVSISLKEIESIKKFSNIIMKYPYEIDLRSDRYIVDAKSILGVLSLDLSKPIAMEIYSDACEDLLKEIAPFVVK